MALHVGLYLVVLGAVIFNRYLSFFVLALMLVGIVFVLGVTGHISWGLTGFGLPALIICCILCTMLFGMHAGIASAIISVISVGIIGTAFYLDHLSLQFDPSPYLNSLSAWAAGIITIKRDLKSSDMRGIVKVHGKEVFKQVLGWPNGVLAFSRTNLCFEQRNVG